MAKPCFVVGEWRLARRVRLNGIQEVASSILVGSTILAGKLPKLLFPCRLKVWELTLFADLEVLAFQDGFAADSDFGFEAPVRVGSVGLPEWFAMN